MLDYLRYDMCVLLNTSINQASFTETKNYQSQDKWWLGCKIDVEISYFKG